MGMKARMVVRREKDLKFISDKRKRKTLKRKKTPLSVNYMFHNIYNYP